MQDRRIPLHIRTVMQLLRVLGLVSICLLSNIFFDENAFCREKRHILVLHSYNKGLEWTDKEDEGIMSVLQARQDEVEVHTEYMDTKRFGGDGGFAYFRAFLEKKYGPMPFSCIICSDDDAFNFVYNNSNSLFRNVPIVFCGVNYIDDRQIAANRNLFTGVVEAFDISTTLRTALRLHPHTSKIVVINDRTTTGRANRRILDTLLPEFAEQVRIEFIEDVTMAELQTAVQALDEGNLVLLMTFNRDSSGTVFDYNRSIGMISRVARIPIYGVWDFYLGKGIVGGMLTSGWDQGKIAAELATQILDGQPIETLPVITRSPNRFMFDYNQLKRFGIARDKLPEGSIIINQPISLMDIHGRVIWAGVAIVGGLVVIIVLLLARMVERRRSVREMEQAHRQTITILESITDGFIAFDRHFRFTYVNTEAEKTLGHDRKTLLGRNYWEIFPFMAGTAVEQLYRQVMVRGTGGDLQYWHEAPDSGPGKWIALKAYPAEDGGVSVYFRDITEEKSINDERIRLATAVEQAAEAIFITDPRWIIQYVNPAFEKMTGYGRSEIVGKHTRLLKSDAHGQDFYRKINATLKAGEVWSGRIVNRKKDGSLFHVEATDTPVRDSYGSIINYAVVSRDITVELRLERELRQAQKMEAIGTLAGGIAHDFNNILAIILGFTEIAMLKLPDPNPVRDHLQRVLDAGARATDLVRQILAFSRSSEHEKRPVEFAVFIKEAMKLLRPLLPTTIEILSDIKVPSRPALVLMDPTEIHQVLMNLCTNAAHAMGGEGGILGIGVTEFDVDAVLASRHLDLEPGGYVCLTVSDTGHGMEGELLERIFDPYFTTKEVGAGTGLGLSVVRGIVKGHGGAVTVSSSPGAGTTFKVFLPRIEGGVSSKAPTAEVFPPGSERILFVDDEQTIAQLGAEMLEPFGYKVSVMTGSREALAAFKANPDGFDLLITDMTMPHLTGKELAREIKAIRPDLPVILCTGFSELINESNAREAGVDDFLMKPYAVGDLLGTLHKVLR